MDLSTAAYRRWRDLSEPCRGFTLQNQDSRVHDDGLAAPSLGRLQGVSGILAKERTRTSLGTLIAVARFILLVGIYASIFIAILGSVDSIKHAHKAPAINFAYRVF